MNSFDIHEGPRQFFTYDVVKYGKPMNLWNKYENFYVYNTGRFDDGLTLLINFIKWCFLHNFVGWNSLNIILTHNSTNKN